MTNMPAMEFTDTAKIIHAQDVPASSMNSRMGGL